MSIEHSLLTPQNMSEVRCYYEVTFHSGNEAYEYYKTRQKKNTAYVLCVALDEHKKTICDFYVCFNRILPSGELPDLITEKLIILGASYYILVQYVRTKGDNLHASSLRDIYSVNRRISIPLVDYILIGTGGYLSLRDEGAL